VNADQCSVPVQFLEAKHIGGQSRNFAWLPGLAQPFDRVMCKSPEFIHYHKAKDQNIQCL
jgi:hypothetical protein